MGVILPALAGVLVALLPGALLFRLPMARREARAKLDAEERCFWYVVISLAWSMAVVLVLAAAGAYRLDRLLMVNGAVSAGIMLAARRRLGYNGTSARPTSSVLLAVVLLLSGVARFFPSSEYIVGGKDPGGYVNQGLLISWRGSFVTYDEEVAAIPESVRTLFFNSHEREEYFDNRFMGFFLKNPDTGEVVGQFPHFYPASIAVAYDLGGIRAALGVVGVWATLGLLAVYFLGTRLVGRPAAFAAGLVLSLNLAAVFFGRYPNTEVVMQAMLFGTLLAFARAHQDRDRFFAPVAGLLGSLLLFIRIDAPLALAMIAVAALLAWILDGRRPLLGFILPITGGCTLGWFYWSGPMRASFWLVQANLQRLPLPLVLGAITAGAAMIALGVRLRGSRGDRLRVAIPLLLTAVLMTLALYAWVFRSPGGRLAEPDAAVLRTFVGIYLLPIGMVATLAGLAIVLPRRFWRDPAFALTTAAFGLFFFYKLHIVHEHLWMARRFLPVILPASLLFAAAAALGTWEQRPRGAQVVRVALGVILLVILGQQYRVSADVAASNVEFKGLVDHVERLAGRFTDRDLVISEARGPSDVHVMAIPLAYIYRRHVLVLENEFPDKAMFGTFLAGALARYDRVFFLGGGGTDLLSPGLRATPVTDVHREVPSYLATPWNAYRKGIRQYKFNYSVYQLELVDDGTVGFSLDVGFQDDLQVVRFGDKELTEGRSFRWSSWRSYVSVRGLTGGEREVALIMQDGGRPAAAPPASVEVFLADTSLGRLHVTGGFREYTLPIPVDALKGAMASSGRQLRLESTTWKPSAFLNSPDTRDLGVMVDRVEIR